jgi:hypothetical protein
MGQVCLRFVADKVDSNEVGCGDGKRGLISVGEI